MACKSRAKSSLKRKVATENGNTDEKLDSKNQHQMVGTTSMMNHSPEPGKAHSTIDKVNVVASIQNGDASNDTVRNFFYCKQNKSNVSAKDCWYDKRNRRNYKIGGDNFSQ